MLLSKFPEKKSYYEISRTISMMASAKTPMSPIVVIKKENIFKTSTPLIIKTAIKRPITKDVFNQIEIPSKRQYSTDALIKYTNQTTLKNENSDTCSDDNTLQKTDESNAFNKEEFSEDEIEIVDESTYNIPMTKTKCRKHEYLLEHKAVGLVKVNDTFASIEDFNNYIFEHAKQWFFYYKRNDSRNYETARNYDKNKKSFCFYQCRFDHKEKDYQAKGMRKRKEKLVVNCPASVMLKREPGQDEYRVKSVCHHHAHELSLELFNTLPHGHRLPREIKDEIRDLARFNVHPLLVRRYIQSKVPGLKLNKTVKNRFEKIRREGIKETLSPERLKEMLEKIKYIKANFALSYRGSKVVVKKRETMQIDSHDFIGSEPSAYDQELSQATNGLQNNCKLPKQQELRNQDDSNTEVNHQIKYGVAVETKNTPDDPNAFEPKQFIIIKQEFLGSDEQMRINNPITHNKTGAPKNEMLVDPTTGNLGERIYPKTAKLESVTPGSSHDETILTNKSVKQYKVGGIFIEWTEDANRKTAVIPNEMKTVNLREEDIKQLSEENKTNNSLKEKNKKLSNVDRHTAPRNRNLKDPLVKCRKRHVDLPEHQAEGLVQLGNTFPSMEEFFRYTSAYASKWFFHYHIYATRNIKTSAKYNKFRSTSYDFGCRFNKGGYISRSKGVKIIEDNTLHCPAAVSMICPPGNNEFTVTYVCHHHNHELSPDTLQQGVQGQKLAPELRDEIRELTWYQLDERLICKYLKAKTGINMRGTVKNFTLQIKKENSNIFLTPEKKKEILEKIEYINNNFTIGPPRRKRKRQPEGENKEFSESEDEENKSRVQARLNNILYDQELLQSVKELQENTGCEIQINTWGGADVIDNGIANLQAGLVEDTGYNDIHPTNEEECQIKIDQELYAMNENVQYIIPSNQDKANIFGVGTSGESDEKVVYIQEVDGETVICDEGENVDYVESSEENREVQCQKDNDFEKKVPYEECDDNVAYEVCDDNVTYEVCDDNVTYYEECNENVAHQDSGENVQYEESAENVAHQECGENVQNEVCDETVAYEECEDNNESVKYVQQINEGNIKSEIDCIGNQNIQEHEEYNEHVSCKESNVIVEHVQQINEGIIAEAECTEDEYTNEDEDYDVNTECEENEEAVGYIQDNNEDDIKHEEEDTQDSSVLNDHDMVSSDNENEYQKMCEYTNENDSDCTTNEQRHKETHEYETRNVICANVGVQADLEIISLEGDSDKIRQLEELSIKDLDKSKYGFGTRGRPQVILQDEIINRFNIEFYIGLSGVAICLEKIAASMSLTVLDLLKQLYQGEAVFRMVVGRSGKQDRRTVHLDYIPLAITFPFEKYKYINCLQEYKAMCSKYSEMAIKLEDTVQKMATDLEEKNIELEKAESQNRELSKNNEAHRNLLKTHDITKKLLQNSQEELAQARAQNEALTIKLKQMEDLQSSRLKDAEILTHFSNPTFQRQNSDGARAETKHQQEIIDEQDADSPSVFSLQKRIKVLKSMLEIANDDVEHGKNKMKKLEDLYLSDSQSLFDRIKNLEAELGPLRQELDYMKSTENPSSYILRVTESENKKLHDSLKLIEESKSSEMIKLRREIKELRNRKLLDSEKYIKKIKRLEETRLALKEQLKKLRNSK